MGVPETCPNCGADVPSGARACPECGADEETGWSEEARYDGAGIPEESFDYDEYVKREFEGKKPAGGLRPLWVVVAVALVIAFVWYLF